MISTSAKPAAADGGSRQCIGSGQNLTAETKATPYSTQAVLPIDQTIVGDPTRRDLGDDFAWLVFNHGHSGPPELRWLHRDRSGT